MHNGMFRPNWSSSARESKEMAKLYRRLFLKKEQKSLPKLTFENLKTNNHNNSSIFLFRKVYHINLKGKLHYRTDSMLKFQG